MTINLNDYIDRLPTAFKTRGGEKAIVEYKSTHPEIVNSFWGYCELKKEEQITTIEIKFWNKDGKIWYGKDLSTSDIISEWQDEPVINQRGSECNVDPSLSAFMPKGDGRIFMSMDKNEKPELTPELLEDIKKGVKAWKVLEFLSKGGSYPDSCEISHSIYRAILKINSEGV